MIKANKSEIIEYPIFILDMRWYSLLDHVGYNIYLKDNNGNVSHFCAIGMEYFTCEFGTGILVSEKLQDKYFKQLEDFKKEQHGYDEFIKEVICILVDLAIEARKE